MPRADRRTRGDELIVGAPPQRAWSAVSLYQAPFRGHRHRVGLMWGALDLSAQRFNGRSLQPPASSPVFLQNGITGEVVVVRPLFTVPGYCAAG